MKPIGLSLRFLLGLIVGGLVVVVILSRGSGNSQRSEPRVFRNVPLSVVLSFGGRPAGVTNNPSVTNAVLVARHYLGITEDPIRTEEGELVEIRVRSEAGDKAIVDVIHWNCADDSIRDRWDRIVLHWESGAWKTSQHLQAWRGARDRNWGILSRIPWLRDQLPVRASWTTNASL
jgi:hypothetical protein